MDTTSLVSLGIAILVILTVQTLVIAALAGHMFIRHADQRYAEEALKVRRKSDLQWRNISAPVAVTRMIPNTRTAQIHPRTHVPDVTTSIHRDPTPPLPQRNPAPVVPPRPQNPTPDHSFANDPVDSVRSSMYSQESQGYSADHGISMANGVHDTPVSLTNFYHPERPV
jgi:hypothetical protein